MLKERWANLIGQRQQVVIKQDRTGSQRIILRRYNVTHLEGTAKVQGGYLECDTGICFRFND